MVLVLEGKLLLEVVLVLVRGGGRSCAHFVDGRELFSRNASIQHRRVWLGMRCLEGNTVLVIGLVSLLLRHSSMYDLS